MPTRDDSPHAFRRPSRSGAGSVAVALAACLALTACGGGGGGSATTGNGPRAPATVNPVGLQFRTTTLPAPAASDGVDYRDAEYRRLWGLGSISAHTAYQRGYFGQGVTIAVADDGMDMTHPDLAGRIVAPKRLIGDDALVSENDKDSVHGTWVAMIAAGARGNTSGTFEVTLDSGAPIPTRNVHGVAPRASIMPIEISGGGEPAAAIRHAVDNGADAINLSIGIPQAFWGTYDGRPGVWLTVGLPYFRPLVRDDAHLTGQFARAAAVLRNRDAVAVWAAGNEGWNAINNRVSMCGKRNRHDDGCELGDVQVPATEFMKRFTREGDAAPLERLWGTDCGGGNCVDYNSGGGWNEAPLFEPDLLGKWLVVGATDRSGDIAPFSNGCGAARNWCLVAPGDDFELHAGGGGIGGTSFAAPMVTGALAVLKSRLPSMRMEVVQALLLVSADPMGVRARNPDEPDPIYGWGRLNLGNAIRAQGAIRLPYSVARRSAGISLRDARVSLSPALAHAAGRVEAVEVAAGDVGGAWYNTKLSGVVDVEASPRSRALTHAAGDMLAPAGGHGVGNSVVFADLGQDARRLHAVGADVPAGAFGRWRLSRDLCEDECRTSVWREWGASGASNPVSPPFFDRAARAAVVLMRGDGPRPFAAFSGRESRGAPWRQFGLRWRHARDGLDLAAELSRIDEERSVWGSTFGAFGDARTETRRTKLFASGPLPGEDWRGFAEYERNDGDVSVSGGMLAGVSGLRAEGWSAGVEGRDTLLADDTLRFSVGRDVRVTSGRLRIDHLLATGNGFVEAFYLGRPQSLEQRRTAIDLRARPTTRWSLGYALPVRGNARLAFGLEYEAESRNRGVSARFEMLF